MLWRGGRRSTNVVDSRGRGPGLVGGGIGTILFIILAAIFGLDPSALIDPDASVDAGSEPGAYTGTPEE